MGLLKEMANDGRPDEPGASDNKDGFLIEKHFDVPLAYVDRVIEP
jgi:hypothetical protein